MRYYVDMKQTAIDNRQALDEIKRDLYTGAITYDQAKLKAAPIIASINTRAAEIAKRHGRRPAKVSFAALMR